MADDYGSDDAWIDFTGSDDSGDMYTPPDDDRAVIEEPDTKDDVIRVDFDSLFESGSSDDAAKIAKTVIKAAEVGLPLIAQIVKASGNQQAATAVGALALLPKLTNKLWDVAQTALTGGDLDQIKVTVPTDSDDALAKVRRAIAASRDE